MKTYSDKAFSMAAPKLWNTLFESVKCCETVDCLKKSLKTHLSKIAMGSDRHELYECTCLTPVFISVRSYIFSVLIWFI